MEYIHHYASPLGGITQASDGESLTGLWFDGQKHAPVFPDEAREEKPLPIFSLTDRWLDLYFEGKEPAFMPQIRLQGTPFQKAVWKLLLTIPYGQTQTYQEAAARLAKEMGRTNMSARAVGAAAGRNPISIIVPCHRLVGKGGKLTGYAGGIERKKNLLEGESSICRKDLPE